MLDCHAPTKELRRRASVFFSPEPLPTREDAVLPSLPFAHRVELGGRAGEFLQVSAILIFQCGSLLEEKRRLLQT